MNRVLTKAEWDPEVQEVIQRRQAVFLDAQRCIQGFKAKICVKADVSSIFCKACPVPHALKLAVEMELYRLKKANVISWVEKSEWGAPIVTLLLLLLPGNNSE